MNNLDNFKQAIILNVHYTGANMALVTIFCEQSGLKKGIVKIAKKRQAELQKGNVIEYIHLKRKEDNLGTFKFNLLEQTFVKYFDNLKAMKNLNHITKTLARFLKEDIPYPQLYQTTYNLFENLGLENQQLVAVYDYKLLKELGFSLDAKNFLKKDEEDTSPAYFISPKTGRIVSYNLGLPYQERLLVLPKLLGGQVEENQTELIELINKFLFNRLFSQ
jgi:DNA repair protein RecO (recombination protein O)